MAQEAFNRKIPLLTSKLNIEFWNKLIKGCVCCNALYGSGTWTVRNLERKFFGELRNVVLEENVEDKMARESN